MNLSFPLIVLGIIIYSHFCGDNCDFFCLVEMWRMLGGRTNQVMEDFDLERCKSLYEDYPAPVVATSDSNVSSLWYIV